MDARKRNSKKSEVETQRELGRNFAIKFFNEGGIKKILDALDKEIKKRDKFTGIALVVGTQREFVSEVAWPNDFDAGILAVLKAEIAKNSDLAILEIESEFGYLAWILIKEEVRLINRGILAVNRVDILRPKPSFAPEKKPSLWKRIAAVIFP